MNQAGSETSSRVDQILDLLLDALQERQTSREAQPPPATPAAPVAPPPAPKPEAPVPKAAPAQAEELLPPPAPVPAGQTGRTLVRLAIGLLLLIVLVNVPIKKHNVSLARILPGSAALVVRDGLLLKGENSDEIYVVQDEKLRWISSLDAFEYYRYRWQDVHIVEESYLDRFEKGRPLHVLLKCDASPHIYALENGKKRWIKDIATFEAEGYVWADVKFVSCGYLRNLLPDGPPIPEDAGPPPSP